MFSKFNLTKKFHQSNSNLYQILTINLPEIYIRSLILLNSIFNIKMYVILTLAKNC